MMGITVNESNSPKRFEGDGCRQKEKICSIMALIFTGESCFTDHTTNS